MIAPLWIIIVLLCALVPPVRAETSDERFLAALRARQLYRLAEAYCRDRLAMPDLPPRAQAEWVAALSHTLAEQALATPTAAQPELWNQARRAAQDFLDAEPDHPFAPLVAMQRALVDLAQGESLAAEGQLAGDAQLLPVAQEDLRAAVAGLDRLAADVARRMQALARATRDPRRTDEALNEHQLRRLSLHISRQSARARLWQAETYPAGSADRVAAATAALERLAPLVQMEPAEPLMWSASLAELRALVLLRRFEAADARLAELEAMPPPEERRDELAAQRIRLALAAGRLDEALAQADALETGTAGPDLDFARLEAYIAAWREVPQGQAAQAADAQARMANLLGEIETAHGKAWSDRGRRMLASVGGPPATAGAMPPSVAEAEKLYLAGKIDEALAAYDRARQAALDTQQVEAALEMAFTAATIEHERRHFAAAAARYRAMALANVNHPRAAEAHLLAIYDLGQSLRAQQPVVLDEYVGWLDEHLARWPRGTTATTARDWLARVHEAAGRWDEALAVYRNVTPDEGSYGAAVTALARLHLAQLAALRGAGEPTAELADSTARALHARLLSSAGRVPDKWGASDRALALAAARAWTVYGHRSFAPAEELLRAALNGAADAPRDWLATARSLLVLSVAGQGRIAEARSLLRDTGNTPLAEQVELLDVLASVGTGLPAATRGELAELMLDIAVPLGEQLKELDDTQRRQVLLGWARALDAAGRGPDALARYEQAMQAFPADRELALEYAQRLTDDDDRAAQDKALTILLQLIKSAPEGRDGWYRATLGLARLYERRGEPRRAAKLISVTKTLHPELGGPTLKAQFLELLARCESAP